MAEETVKARLLRYKRKIDDFLTPKEKPKKKEVVERDREEIQPDRELGRTWPDPLEDVERLRKKRKEVGRRVGGWSRTIADQKDALSPQTAAAKAEKEKP